MASLGRPSTQVELLLLLSVAIIPAGWALKVIPDNLSPYSAANPLDAQYVVALHNDKVASHVLPKRSRTMVDAQGRKYVCAMPARSGAPGGGIGDGKAAADEEGGSATALTKPLQLEDADEDRGGDVAAADASTRPPFEMINSLKTMCLYRNDGLWMYEMCYKKNTRQFRQQDQGGRAEDFSCGKYIGDEAQNTAVQEDVLSSSGSFYKYVSHVMQGGENCSLTGQPRTSEVRFTCMRDVTENSLISVREFPTCNYIFTVSTTFLCSHPLFKPPPEPMHTISCTPAAESEPYVPPGDSGRGTLLDFKLGGVEVADEGSNSAATARIRQRLVHHRRGGAGHGDRFPEEPESQQQTVNEGGPPQPSEVEQSPEAEETGGQEAGQAEETGGGEPSGEEEEDEAVQDVHDEL